MKRRGRADEVLAAARDPEFQRRLCHALAARTDAVTGTVVRELALELLPVPVDGVAISFRWDADAQRVDVKVKGASVPADEQAGAGTEG